MFKAINLTNPMYHKNIIASIIVFCFLSGYLYAQDAIYTESEIETKRDEQGKKFYFLKGNEENRLNGNIRILLEESDDQISFNGIAYLNAKYENGYIQGTASTYEDEILLLELEYKDGVEHGDILYYFPDGSISMQGQYKEGKECGEWLFFVPEGELASKTIFSENGKKLQHTKYYENGNIDSDRMWKENGNDTKLIYRRYTEDGLLLAEHNYTNGTMHGTQKRFDYESDEGGYISIFEMKDGIQNGEYKEIYLKSDIVKKEGKYVDDREEGTWIYRDKQGNITGQEVYKNGVLIE